MLQKLSDEVRECHAHAKDCARKAAAQTEPALGKASWMPRNAGYDCSSASPHRQSLSAIKFAVPGPFLFRHLIRRCRLAS